MGPSGGWIIIIATIVGGLLASANFIIGKKPESKELIEQIRPAQGWIGVVLLILGLIYGIQMLIYIRGIISAISYVPILTIASIASVFIGMIGVGFILGYDLLNQFVLSKSDEAKEKAENIRKKLLPLQTTFGLIGAGSGLWLLIASIFGIFI